MSRSLAPGATDRSPSPKWLPLEKMPLELPIFAQPKLGLRNRGSQWTREPFVDHPGSLNRRRVRNDVADCNDDDHRDSERNDHSLGVSHDVATHGQSPIHRVRHLWCPCRYNDRSLSNTPVTNFIGAQIFLPATVLQSRRTGCAQCALESVLHAEQSRGPAQLRRSRL
jgi:hypothetical protein